ncbi:hypothetical protein C3489_09765 [Streptomyces sp. Ru71]|uniref:hypothetical protein n=1 Tax=Streptomyces sp. Ru71 TaxID=2080746 RepID=UPI000CDDEC91|nr:hypothetical protein [Streptomyces sp. Ru71]POX55590.1 hypothetical protein C3489_09765 [Streptomyces sp. Ru71]
MDRDEPVCPVCGQPVERVVRRHKTLGAWVPVWGPGPCRNPECPAARAEEEPGGVAPAEEAAQKADDAPRKGG